MGGVDERRINEGVAGDVASTRNNMDTDGIEVTPDVSSFSAFHDMREVQDVDQVLLNCA